MFLPGVVPGRSSQECGKQDGFLLTIEFMFYRIGPSRYPFERGIN